MKSLRSLKKVAGEGLAWVQAQPGIREAEVFVASNDQLYARLNYTSGIACNGVEEPKSLSSFGVGLRVALQDGDGVKTGFGSELGRLSLDGVERALDRARQGAVADPEFVSLPKPSQARPVRSRLHDPLLMSLDDEAFVSAGWRVVEGALETFAASEELVMEAGGREKLGRLGIVLGGDVTLLRERIAVASTHFPQVQADESTVLLSGATAMVERSCAKGSGWSAHARWQDFTAQAGVEAARNAIRSMGGQRVTDGEFRVVLGPQPVTDLLHNLVLPSLRSDVVYAMASAFSGKLGKAVAWDKLSIYDHGALPGFVGSKRITCEGLPTGRTDLITRGQLVGLLSNHYESQRLLTDPKAREKLGADPHDYADCLTPRNGFRFMEGGGRHFQVTPQIAATNVFVESAEGGLSRDELLRRVGNGLYIGRIWYTYPINGLARGDFTCTVVGDSYVIKDGRLGPPLRPNTVRINDNIHRVLNGILGVGSAARPTIVWAADQIVHAPEMAVSVLTVRQIAASGYVV